MHVCERRSDVSVFCVLYTVSRSAQYEKTEITLYSLLLYYYYCFGRMITASSAVGAVCGTVSGGGGPSIGLLCCCIFMRLNYKSIISPKTP
jgi:hypothetical protein